MKNDLQKAQEKLTQRKLEDKRIQSALKDIENQKQHTNEYQLYANGVKD